MPTGPPRDKIFYWADSLQQQSSTLPACANQVASAITRHAWGGRLAGDQIPRHSPDAEPEDIGWGIVEFMDSFGRTIHRPADRAGNPSRERIIGKHFVSPAVPFEHHFSFTKCVFDQCILEFEDCDFTDCTFKGGYSSGVEPGSGRHGGDVSGITRCRFYGCRFSRCDFSRVYIWAADFVGCIFDQSRFDHTSHLNYAHFVRGTRGFETCRGLHAVRIEKEHQTQLDSDVMSMPLPFSERLASWERLRTFGRLPLFGVSFSALVAIPVTTFLLAAYNDQIEHLREWTVAHSSEIPPRFMQLADRVQTIPLPSLTFWLLVSTALLALASILYALMCPPRVKEFSLEQWVDQFGHPGLHYLSLSWRARWPRVIAFGCYCVGGTLTGLILIAKGYGAGRFIIENTMLPWWLW